MNIIIARILGVNDKMVQDDSILDVPCYIPQNFVNTFSDYELGYYKLLYVVFDKHSKLREANLWDIENILLILYQYMIL